ncbi:invasin domain 3-containing protein [Paenibacillaceae bacterium WGS1546]|uniref:invasin domain 3-containing protein n=1 Tax=Cohnella sp. WGS1546 TaxID=3366810 RepID=UPI00372D1A04
MLKKLVHILLAVVLTSAYSIALTAHPKSVYAWTGSGAENDPYVIYTENDFNHFAQNVYYYAGSHFKLGNDLDFRKVVRMIPLGNDSTPFYGTFDGNGFTIYNPTNDGSYYTQGIFGTTQDAIIKNVKVRDLAHFGVVDAGGIVGKGYNTHIMNCSVEGGIIGGNLTAGGLIGKLIGGSVTNSYVNNVTVSTLYSAGGLVGDLSGTITHSFFRGMVRSEVYAGGLVGLNWGSIVESFADAHVEQVDLNPPFPDSNPSAGGLAGVNVYGSILQSYARGTVKGNKIGGLAGENASLIRHAYAANQLIPTNNFSTGGLVYRNAMNDFYDDSQVIYGKIENSFWDIDTANQIFGVVSDEGNNNSFAGHTTNVMQTQDTYEAWDFDQVWAIGSNQYPHLKKANLIELDSGTREVSIEAGKTESVDMTAIYSNGTFANATDMVTAELLNLPDSTVSKSGGQISITGGKKANGYLKVSYGGVTNQIRVTVTTGPMSIVQSKVMASSSTVIADGTTTMDIVVTLVDDFDNPVQNRRVALQQTGSSTIVPDPAYADGDFAITDQTGTAKFTISSTKAEPVVYQAVVSDASGNEVSLNQTAAVTFVSGPMYAGNAEMTVSSNRLVADGSGTVPIVVQLKDEFGNPLTEDGGTLEIYANSDKLTVNQAVYGTYTADLIVPPFTMKVLITAYHLDENGNALLLPVQEIIDFIPGPATVETSSVQARKPSLYADGTSQTTIVVQLKDRYYNDLTDDTLQGDVVEISTNLGVISTTKYVGDGQFEAVLTASNEVGTATITARINQHLIDDFATVDFTSGPLSLAQSTLTADRTSISADGRSTAIIHVQLMDDYGHKIERDEGEVVLITSLGTISQADYVADGMYQATLKAGTTTGQAVITGSIDGNQFLDKAVVQLTSVSRPNPDPGPAPGPVNPGPASSVPENSNQSHFTVYAEDGKETTVSFRDEEIASDRSISLETYWVDGEAKLSFSSSTLEHIMELNSFQRIEIQAGETFYQLPADQLDINDIAQMLGNREFEIVIAFKSADDDVSASASEAAEQLGAEMLVTPIEFTITAKANGGKAIDWASFTQYVTRTLEIDGAVDPYLATGARFHPDTGAYEPVPTTFEQHGGKIRVHLHSLSNSYYTVIKNDITFMDMQKHWAKTEVERMANKWIIKGKGNHLFDPSGTLTRAEAITLLVRALGLNEATEDSPYQDVSQEWFAGAVNTAFKAGLIAGSEGVSSSSRLKPTEKISREELTAMLARAIKYADRSIERDDRQQLLRFKDEHTISEWARESVAIASHYGIIKGDDRGNFNPQNTTSRAEAAVMLDRLLQAIGLRN